MAQQEKSVNPGGNRPKPQGGGAKGGNTPKPGQSAKDRSKAQSRPVSASSSGKKSGGGRPPAGRGPGGRGGAPTAPKRMSGALMAWIAVGVVIVVIAALVIVKLASNNTSTTPPTPVTPASPQLVSQLTTIPTSVFDSVGVTYPTGVTSSPPTVKHGNPPLTIDGKTPAMLYYGAEYCPYCAAERWAVAIALSRFGTWSGLNTTASSGADVFPSTHTLSFRSATLTSPYITFTAIERYTNVPLASGAGYTDLEIPTAAENKIITTYAAQTPGASSTGQIGFPFIDINNTVLISGATYTPAVLEGLTWSEIGSGLNDPTNPVTQAIIATSNYISAGICHATGGQPADVCNSSGVQAATKALKL